MCDLVQYGEMLQKTLLFFAVALVCGGQQILPPPGGSGGAGITVSPWTACSSGCDATVGASPVTVNAGTAGTKTSTTHGQGVYASAKCLTSSDPRDAASCGYTRDSSGNLVISFTTAPGMIEIDAAPGVGATGAPGANGSNGTNGSTGATGAQGPVGTISNGWPVTYTDSTHLSIGTNPSGLKIGNTFSTVPPSAATVTIGAGTGTVFIYVDTDGVLKAGSNVTLASCTLCTIAAGSITEFPPYSYPIAEWTTTSGTFDVSGGTPFVTPYGINPLAQGTNISISCASGLCTVNWLAPGTVSTGSNCISAASPAVCGTASAGSIAIPTGAGSTLTVNTTAVTANSQIFIYPDDTLGTRLGVTCNSTIATLAGGSAITARTAGTSFTLTFNGTIAANPVCVGFLIVN